MRRLWPFMWIGWKKSYVVKYDDLLISLMHTEAGRQQVNVAQMREVLSIMLKLCWNLWSKNPVGFVRFLWQYR